MPCGPPHPPVRCGQRRPPRRAGRQADPGRPGPPPRACSLSDGEVEVANLVDDLWIAGCGTAGVPAEERQDQVLRRVEAEHRVAAVEVALLRLRRPFAVFDRDAPFAAPRAGDLDPILEVGSLS